MKNRIEYVKDNLFLNNYFQNSNSEYKLKEEVEEGKSVLSVELDNDDNLCVEDFDNAKKCEFFSRSKGFGMRKSVDHIIFENCSGNCTLHMIEMKTTVGQDTFKGVKQKVRSSYLNAMAIASALDINISNVIAYTTYAQLKFDVDASASTNPRGMVAPLGEKIIDVKKEEWDQNIMRINLGDILEIKHQPIKMTKQEDVLVGNLSLVHDQ